MVPDFADLLVEKVSAFSYIVNLLVNRVQLTITCNPTEVAALIQIFNVLFIRICHS